MSQNTPTPPMMGMTTEKKKSHRCLTCCIICLVIVVLFVGALIGASAFAFNKFVSPAIGGVKFGSAVKLMGGLYNGNSKRSRAKILTDTYTEEDLSDFYDELNAHLFLKVRAVADLEAQYDGLSEEEKATVLAELQANAKWNYNYKQKSDADKPAYVKEYYVAANRYPLTVAKLLSVVDIDKLTGGSEDNTQALADYVSTQPETRLAAAGEAEGDDASAILTDLLKDLEFDFKSGLLGSFDYTQSEDYAANIESVNFEITGSEIAAVVGEVVSQVLSKFDFGEMMGGNIEVDMSEIYLPAYVAIPQVIIQHKDALPDNPTEEQKAAYEKNTYVSATLQLEIKKLLSNKALQDSVKATLGDMLPSPSLVNVAFGVVKAILPKALFITVGFYPLDSEQAAFVKINNYKEQQQQDLAKIINTVAGGNMFDSDTVGTDGSNSESADVMQQLNAKVASLFASLEEKGIPLTFIDAGDEKNAKRVGLRLAHVQMLLNMMNAYDPTGENGITPYLFMTVLKCLFSDATVTTPTEGDLDALYTEIQTKYGIQKTFWQNGGLLNTDNLQNIPANISIKDINLQENAAMRVNLQDRQLLSLFVRAKEEGALEKLWGESGTAAAGDADVSTVNDLMDSLDFSLMSITRVPDTNVYKLSIRATLSITNILNKLIGEEEGILKTLSSALPNSMSFGISVFMHADADGKITVVGADEEGNYATSFLVNAFNEFYTTRVLNTISTLMRCLNGGNGGFDMASLQEKIDSAFDSMLNQLKDNLYVSIGIKDGALVLPSIYEVVQGFGQKKINDSATLTDADNLTTEEIRGVLTTVYHADYSPAAYNATVQHPGDDMLADLQSKYYLAESWSAEDLFGGNVNLGDKLNADSLNFRDKQVGAETVTGLYRDTRTLDQLRVNIAGDALADLIEQSGKLSDISAGAGNDMLKSLSVVNCSYAVGDGKTYADFIFNARLSETAAGADEGASGFDINTLLPDSFYLTARLLMNRQDGDYTAEPRFSTELVVNGNSAATNNIFKLIKLFSGEEFDRTSVTNQVSTSVEDAFSTIEDSVNLVYGNSAENAMQLDTIFNTINKVSNKPTEEQKADPAYVPYQSNYADDAELMHLMREFGRDPVSTTVSVAVTGGNETVVKTVDVNSYSDADIFNIYYNSADNYNIPTTDDQAAFFATFNENFYVVNNDKKLNVNKINGEEQLVIDEDFIDLPTLYADIRPYNELITYADDKQLASIINAIYASGIEIKEDGGTSKIGTAKVLAVHIEETYLQVFIKVDMNLSEENANKNLMPQTLYLTTKTYLVDIDGEGEKQIYDTEVCINNLSYADTKDLFDRLNNLADGMNLDFSLDLDNITAPVKDNLQDVFDTKIKQLGNVKYHSGKLEIPSLFSYLTDGKLTKTGDNSTYDTSRYMVDIDITGTPDYYETHDAATDENKTDPAKLMYRMRELGKAQSADQLYTWTGWTDPNADENGNIYPTVGASRYNDNPYAEADLEAFFDQLQAYYFFIDRPTADWFNNDNAANIFNDISANLDTKFNLSGYANTFSGAMADYATAGLYHYNSTQYGAKLDGKALAGLMASLGNDVLEKTDNIDTLSISSVKLDWDKANNYLYIEITVKVDMKPGDDTKALPSSFYMTTITRRDSSTNPATYKTMMTLNRFAIDVSAFDDTEHFDAAAGDLAIFLNNLAHVGTFDIKSQLNVNDICNKITTSISTMFERINDYIIPFSQYDNGADYIEFYNVYRQIGNKLSIDFNTYSDVDMMHVIYKLHNTLGKQYTSYNAKDAGDTIIYNDIDYIHMTISATVTDRAFANVLQSYLQSNKGDYVENVDSIFFVGEADNDVFTNWQAFIDNADNATVNSFTMGDADAYILATVKVNLGGTSVSTAVASLLPDYIYLSLVMKYDSVNGNALVTTTINDFYYIETQLALSFLTDDADNLDFESSLNSIVNSNLPAGTTFTRSDDFNEYIGKGDYNYAYVP